MAALRIGVVRGRSTERAARDFARLPSMRSGVASCQNWPFICLSLFYLPFTPKPVRCRRAEWWSGARTNRSDLMHLGLDALAMQWVVRETVLLGSRGLGHSTIRTENPRVGGSIPPLGTLNASKS